MATETIQIDGMGCNHCVSAVRTALEQVEGVEIEQVEIGTARVRYEASADRRQALDDAIRNAGYEPVAHTTQ